MKVTITIEDAPGEDTTTVTRSEDRGEAAAATVTGTPSVTGLPYVKGPNQVAISTNAAGIVLSADEARSLAPRARRDRRPRRRGLWRRGRATSSS